MEKRKGERINFFILCLLLKKTLTIPLSKMTSELVQVLTLGTKHSLANIQTANEGRTGLCLFYSMNSLFSLPLQT